MDLQQIAETDLATTLESNGQLITVTDPVGVSADVQGLSNDISLLIDPDTGVPVSGRNANVSLRLSTLKTAGIGTPKGIEDGASVPWLVEYTTVEGQTIKARVMASNPDRSLGIVTLKLGLVV